MCTRKTADVSGTTWSETAPFDADHASHMAVVWCWKPKGSLTSAFAGAAPTAVTAITAVAVTRHRASRRRFALEGLWAVVAAALVTGTDTPVRLIELAVDMRAMVRNIVLMFTGTPWSVSLPADSSGTAADEIRLREHRAPGSPSRAPRRAYK